MSAIASPLSSETPFPCMRGGALFDTLRRWHGGRLPVLHVTTCPGHIAVRFRLTAQSISQKGSNESTGISTSSGSTEYGLRRDRIVTFLFDSGHGRQWAMPSTRDLHAFIDNICKEADGEVESAWDPIGVRRDAYTQLDTPLLAVPYASEDVRLEVFLGGPWMPHLKTLKFLAVDGGGLARLHSFNNDSWRLDCTFRLLPSAASCACISGNMAYWVDAGVGVRARTFHITADGSIPSKIAAADNSSSDSDDHDERNANESTVVSLGLTSVILPALHVLALFPCHEGIFTLYVEPDATSNSTSASDNGAPLLDLDGARLWVCLDREGYPRASTVTPWRLRNATTPSNTTREVGTRIAAWRECDEKNSTTIPTATAQEGRSQSSIPVQLFLACRPSTAELVVMETLESSFIASNSSCSNAEKNGTGRASDSTTPNAALPFDELLRAPQLFAVGMSTKGAASDKLAYRFLCALTNFWDASAPERSIPASLAVHRHLVLILSAGSDGSKKDGSSTQSSSNSDNSSSSSSSNSRVCNASRETKRSDLALNSDGCGVNWYLEAFDLRSGVRVGSRNLAMNDAKDSNSFRSSPPTLQSLLPSFWVAQSHPAPPQVVMGFTVPGRDAAALHVTRLTSHDQGEPQTLASAMASARCAAASPGLGATSYGAAAAAMTLAKVALEAGADPVRALHQAGFREPGALPPAAVKALLAMATGSTCASTTTATSSTCKPRMPRCLLEKRFREAGWLPDLSESIAATSSKQVTSPIDAHRSAEADGFGSGYDGSGAAEQSSLGLRCRAALGHRQRFMQRTNSTAPPPSQSSATHRSTATQNSDLQPNSQDISTTERSNNMEYYCGTLSSVLMSDAVAFLEAVKRLDQFQKQDQPLRQHTEKEVASSIDEFEPSISSEDTSASMIDAMRTSLDAFIRYRPTANMTTTTGACSSSCSSTSNSAVLQGVEETFEVTCRILFESKPELVPPFVAALQRGPSALSALPVPSQQQPRHTTGYATRALACLNPRANDKKQVQARHEVFQMASLPER